MHAEGRWPHRRLVRADRWDMSSHARERMVERGFAHEDLLAVFLARETTCRPGQPGRWRLDGRARNGDALALSVELQDLVLIVTLFGGDEP